MQTAFKFFHSTHCIQYGPGCLADLPAIAAAEKRRKAAVLMDAFFLGGPVQDRLAESLKEFSPSFHAVPQHEPDTDTVDAARKALIDAEADLIVAVGGGSAMDTAKAARMLVSNPGPIEDIVGAMGMPMLPHESLFVAVPTTAGTGSEVSESAVIAKVGTDYKAVLRSANMGFRLALLDPELGVTAPPHVTAAAGYDAVTHAAEAFTSKVANVMTDPLARSAMELLARSLPVVFDEPGNIAARGECLIGSMQAGVAFNSAHLGLAHAIAGALGALHHVPHGLANALALPWSMAFNDPALGDKGEVLAGIFGGSNAAEGLSALRHRVGLDLSLDDYVPGDAERDLVAEGASKSGQLKVNPRPASMAEIRVILEHMRHPTGGRQPHLNL
ncbi:iron-containing alcohol dehydrogenase [Pelagibius sp. CAU 1746]|uniref:iron-containing alcohol dehydrogenase family protein n=1 Tax=Pelagibius sp. CAU 1746 TaxID=3140370 RepID=UPI00325BAF45